jgi:protein-disulfide isomerase
MKKTLLIIVGGIALLAVYKHQHVKPIDDPKDSPLFQQRLQSSLDRFQDGVVPAQSEMKGSKGVVTGQPSGSSAAARRTKDLIIAGSCGKVTMTWVEEKKVNTEKIEVRRRTQSGGYVPLQGAKIFERAEEGEVRYWVSDGDLDNGVRYEYLIAVADEKGAQASRGPLAINLTCTEKDREVIAQREKMVQEYYQKQGMDRKTEAAATPAGKQPLSTSAKEPTITGRCGSVTMTWFEEKKLDKKRIQLKRRSQGGEYTTLAGKMIYDREEAGGVRYWASDSGLENGMQYEYLVAVADAQGAGSSRGPVSINLTCTEKDREIVAQREKMVKEYYQKKGIAADTQPAASPAAPSYQLSSERYEVAPGDSPRQGERTLPVTVVVFSDFECIHCSAWAETLHAIRKSFPAEVSIVYKNLPLAYHARAEFAAKAALAAGEQGKFWEMHDILYKNRTALGEKEIFGYAGSLGLNLERFKQSLASERIQKVIAEDKRQGEELGVQNIPTSFINGKKLVGAPPASMVEEMIGEILQQKSGG